MTSASVINSAPFHMMFIQGDFAIEGQAKPTLSAGMPKIEAGYFTTMGIPLRAGRDFTTRDTAEAPKVAIVREYFPGGPNEALGRRVRLDDDGEWLTVVGVVADIRRGEDARAAWTLPDPRRGLALLAVRRLRLLVEVWRRPQCSGTEHDGNSGSRVLPL